MTDYEKAVCFELRETAKRWSLPLANKAADLIESQAAELNDLRMERDLRHATPSKTSTADEYPTTYLRFVSKDINGRTLQILQQLWEIRSADLMPRREWRDVPLTTKGDTK
jgi:hypothetical protein